MKKILITGANSYIGTSLAKWLKKYPDDYYTETLDMMDNSWKKQSFGMYDVVFHVAGIAHIKETKKNYNLYFKVNRDLAHEVAKKAKFDGVKQFVFISSMSVYGIETGIIDKNTPLIPKTMYGESKLQAEELISELEDELFKLAIIRAPMVYGKGCKGNYPRLASLALKTPLFPEFNNKRSMIFIDNLSEFIRLVIDYRLGGLFFPQNEEYVNTTKLVALVAKAHGKRLRKTRLFNPVIHLGTKFSKTLRKVFGSFVYKKEMNGGPGCLVNGNLFEYETCSFEESIEQTER